MTYSLPCAEGHDPVMLTVEADNDEAAMPLMLEKVHEHHRQMHADDPGLVNMSDDDAMDYIRSHWTKA